MPVPDARLTSLDREQQVCAHCGAKRLGRAFVCVKCEKPWQPAAAGGADRGRGEKREDAASPPARRSFRVAHPEAVAAAAPAPSASSASPLRAAPPEQRHAPSDSSSSSPPPPPPPRGQLSPARTTLPAQAGGGGYGSAAAPAAAPAPVCLQSVRQSADVQDELSEEVPLLFDDSCQVRARG